ncbi:hypothetical protein A0J61_11275 [Choanephora cucurbitarum]|uniref:Uncharacterized protein n=1 Tax=Choanephora cucurbitarum TaxID=101091 RepID=A0A1C7MW43_9FUNG|nr:hypothetical protein A0J61_11275 [Choanephora cucurbitarum]
MKYVAAFRDAEGDYEETLNCIYQSSCFLICNVDSFVDGRSRIAEEPSSVPESTLSEATEVKKPGRPVKTQRLSSLPKDFASAKFRKALLQKKLKKKKRKKNDVKEKPLKMKVILKQQPDFSISADINQDDAVSTYSPKSDGYGGFEAAAYLLYGDEEQLPKVKETMFSVMLKEFEDGMSYEDFYRSSFGMTITCGIDLHKKEDKMTHYDRHRKSKTAGMSFWFDIIDCMQVLADTYCRPVCYHLDSGSKSQLDIALTYFPLVLPKRLDQKLVPFYLQYIGGIHWGAVEVKKL